MAAVYNGATMHVPIAGWIAFNVFVVLMLALDLGLHRKAHTIRFREAMAWTAFWISLAAAFAVLIYYWEGHQPTLEFVTGYVVEESLSVDNLFVFLMLFRYFRVPGEYQHKVLTYGIVGALTMRLLFILAGVALIRRVHWIMYLFGAVLIYVGLRMLRHEEADIKPQETLVMRLIRRWVPVTSDYVNGKFLVIGAAGRRIATPLLVVLLVVETTDVLFATDSIPAVLAITRDPFIVYTSNVFAILGLRSLFFALAGMIEIFHHLHYGLSAVLVFIGIKMLVGEFYPIPTHIALIVVGALLAAAVAASLIFPPNPPEPETEA